MNLTLEVVDILDELNILLLLLEKQNDVAEDLARMSRPFTNVLLLGKHAENLHGQTRGRLEAKRAETTRLCGEVRRTHDLVSCMASEPVIVRRFAYRTASSSWSCWT